MAEREDIAEEAEVPTAPDAEAAAPEAPADDAALEAEAAKFGWKPREKWKGDATNWVDARTYVERSKTLLPVLEGKLTQEREAREREAREYAERIERIERTTQEAMKRQKALMEAEIERAKAEAATAKRDLDFDRFETATKRVTDLERQATAPIPQPVETPQVDPVVRDWLERTPATRDPRIAKMLPDIGDEAMRYGYTTPAEQVDYAERKLRGMFPEKFTAPAAPARTFAAVDGGSLTPPKARRSVADLPADARRIGEAQVKEGLWKDLGEYADAYWSA